MKPSGSYFVGLMEDHREVLRLKLRQQWRLKESADWWSAGQGLRQQLYGAATEMMLDLASFQGH
jgi:hypothetical protein